VAALGAIVLGLTGCDENLSDRQVRNAIAESIQLRGIGGAENEKKAKESLEAAARSTDASAASRAQSKALLAQVHLDAAREIIRQIDQKELELARTGFEVGQLATQLDSGAILLTDYRQYDPAPLRAKLTEMISAAQGAPDKPTWDYQGKTMPTIAATRQRISELETQLATLQSQARSMEEQRNGLLTEAESAAQSSESLKGQKSVEEFRRASELRRKAADLFTQIDSTNAQMVPVQRDLAVAQGQHSALEQAVGALEAQIAQLDQSWQGIQQQMNSQVELARRITGSEGASGDAGSSIAGKATEISRIAGEIKTLRQDAQSNLDDAVKLFGDANQAADELRRELRAKDSDPANASRPERKAWQSLMAVLHPQHYRVRQGAAQRMLAGLFASEAMSLFGRINLQQSAGAAIERAGATVPAELRPGGLAQEMSNALKLADEAYKTASETLSGVTEGDSPPEAKKAATVEHMFALYGWSQTNGLTNDKAAADEHLREALLKRDQAIEQQVQLPALPPELAPPPPSTQPAEPTTAPSETPAEAPATEPATTTADDAAPPADAGAEPPAAPPAGDAPAPADPPATEPGG
jgi:hypothetical protein